MSSSADINRAAHLNQSNACCNKKNNSDSYGDNCQDANALKPLGTLNFAQLRELLIGG